MDQNDQGRQAQQREQRLNATAGLVDEQLPIGQFQDHTAAMVQYAHPVDDQAGGMRRRQLQAGDVLDVKFRSGEAKVQVRETKS